MNKLIKLVGFVAAFGLCVVATTKADYWFGQYFHDTNLTESTDYVEVSSACNLYGSVYHSTSYSSAWLTARPLDEWGQPGQYVLSIFAGGSESSAEGGASYGSPATFEVKAQSAFSGYGGYADFNISIGW